MPGRGAGGRAKVRRPSAVASTRPTRAGGEAFESPAGRPRWPRPAPTARPVPPEREQEARKVLVRSASPSRRARPCALSRLPTSRKYTLSCIVHPPGSARRCGRPGVGGLAPLGPRTAHRCRGGRRCGSSLLTSTGPSRRTAHARLAEALDRSRARRPARPSRPCGGQRGGRGTGISGSPTVRVDGEELFPHHGARTAGLRVYATDGLAGHRRPTSVEAVSRREQWPHAERGASSRSGVEVSPPPGCDGPARRSTRTRPGPDRARRREREHQRDRGVKTISRLPRPAQRSAPGPSRAADPAPGRARPAPAGKSNCFMKYPGTQQPTS